MARRSTLKSTDIRQVDGVWSAFRTQMRTLQGSKVISETVLDVLSLKNDTPEVSERDFTQERLARGM